VITLSKALAPRPPVDAPTPTTLTVEEVSKLHSFEVEASIPEHLRIWCPSCHLINLLPEPMPAPSRMQRLAWWLRLKKRPVVADMQCAYCDHSWDPRAEEGDNSYNERATAAFIRLTSQPCPNPQCKQRISHFHGHACHHISPSTDGCPNCHQHFCYVCLRRHGTPGGGYHRNPRCRHGSSYCKEEGIHRHLRHTPYPHDRRCGCPICSYCRPSQPCPQCDGSCVVCKGIVPPAPQHVPADQISSRCWSCS